MSTQNEPLMGWREWTIVIATLIVLLAVAAILFPEFRGFVASSVTAAWVQALGSIGAIFVAIGVARHQAIESERKAEQQRLRDALARRAQGIKALELISAELLSYRTKRLAALDNIMALLQEGKDLPDIPSVANDFQAYRRAAYPLILLDDALLGQRIHDIYADIDTLHMNMALYEQARSEYIDAYRANEGRYDSTSYLALKAADRKVTRQGQELALMHESTKANIDSLLLDISATNSNDS